MHRPTPSVNPLATSLAALALALAAGVVGAATPSLELAGAMREAGADGSVPVIAFFRERSATYAAARALAATARAQRRREIPALLRARTQAEVDDVLATVRASGGARVRTLWIANAIALEASPALVQQLLDDPRVLEVRLDAVTPAPVPIAGLPSPVEWNLAAVGVPALWRKGFRGDGVVVASLDTGVDIRHPELATRWRGAAGGWFDPYGEHAAPFDVNGHGTQTMGILVGGDANGASIGIAPAAKWIAAKIFDDSGAAKESAVHLAFQWLLDPDGDPATDDAPDVVNNSWDIVDAGGCSSVFQPDIDALRSADIAVVFSAGNYGPLDSTSVSPANNANVVSVGSVGPDGAVSAFSSRGPGACDGSLFPKIVAPGDGILTTDVVIGNAPLYVEVAGTSFAAPHVAGVIALLRGAVPAASAADVERAVLASAHDVDVAGPDPAAGYGLLDAAAALAALQVAPDDDGDGYRADVDCNDANAAVHPGAAERARDGVDQDCNGMDLTVRVHFAVYGRDGETLRVRATSLRGADAALEIADVGAMTYRAAYGDWVYDGAVSATNAPVTVQGPEGRVTVKPRPVRRR